MPNASDGIVKTRREAALLLGVTEKQLGNDANEPWFPADAVERDARGRRINWNVPKIRAARNAAKRNPVTADAGGEGGLDDLVFQAKANKAVQEAKRLELENEKRRLALDEQRGRLVPREALELFGSTLLTSLGDWAGQIPDLAAAVVPKKYRRKLKDFLNAELDNRRRQTAADLERAARDFDAQSREEHAP